MKSKEFTDKERAELRKAYGEKYEKIAKEEGNPPARNQAFLDCIDAKRIDLRVIIYQAFQDCDLHCDLEPLKPKKPKAKPKELKTGDKVTIRSREWYDKNKNEFGSVDVPFSFTSEMAKYCGREATIRSIFQRDHNANICYKLNIDGEYWAWGAEMFEP